MKPFLSVVSGLSAACLAFAPCAVLGADAFHFKQSRLSAAQFDAYLAKKRHHKTHVPSPLGGKGNSFLLQGKTYDIDPRLIVAIAGQETSFATRVCGSHNAWNWFWGGSCSRSPFDSYERGIQTVSKYMRRSYLNKGYTTIPLIRRKYCIDGCEAWTRGVTFFFNQLVALEAAPQAGTQPPSPTPPQPDAPPKAPIPAPPAPAPLPPATPAEPLATTAAPALPAAPVEPAHPSTRRLLLQGGALGVLVAALVGGVAFLSYKLGRKQKPS